MCCLQAEVQYDLPQLVPPSPSEPWELQQRTLHWQPARIPYWDVNRADALLQVQELRDAGIVLSQFLTL